jgi:hypothetical protein
MAARGWANATVTAIGVAAGAGAAQLGLAYGLGIIAWQPVRDATGEGLWLASLMWALWIAATSTVLGAVYAGGLATRANAASKKLTAGNAAGPDTAVESEAAGAAADGDGGHRRTRAVDLLWRTAVALAAAVGALITVPLVMLPASAAHRADTFQPQVTAGAYAVVGVVVGLVVAVVAVNVRVIAANIVASTAWVWALAAVSVVDAVRANRTAGTAQLAAWQFTDRGWFHNTLYLPGALLMVGGALLAGVFGALPADRRADNRVGIAISGTFGPLLVAAAYFLAAPNLTVRAEQLSSYLFAPYAVIGGLAGSVLVAVLGPMRPRRARAAVAPDPALADDPAAAPGTAPKATGDAELTEWTRTLAVPSDEPRAAPASPEAAAVTTGTGSAETTAEIGSAAPGATGRATVTQPASPGVPKPRKRRGSGGSATAPGNPGAP